MVCKLYLKEEGRGRGEKKEKETIIQEGGTRGGFWSPGDVLFVWSGAGYEGMFYVWKFIKLFVYALCTILYKRYMPVTKFTERKHSHWAHHFFPSNKNLLLSCLLFCIIISPYWLNFMSRGLGFVCQSRKGYKQIYLANHTSAVRMSVDTIVP